MIKPPPKFRARSFKSRWDQEEPKSGEKRIKLDEDQTESYRSSDSYDKLEKIGEGTFGKVYRALDLETNQIVALKKFKLEKETEGFPITSLRETMTLLKSKHPNVIDVRDIVFGKKLDEIFIVMDYMDRDLKAFMQDMKRPFNIPEIKLLMQQLLNATAHLHDNWIIHRDLKPSNLLINGGTLKLGDFGSAREYGSPLKKFTNEVVTLWYRAPELLLQKCGYSTPIDVWSIGCIFGELLIMKPLFPGQTEQQQIDLIFEGLGSPNEVLWPDYGDIRANSRFKLPTFKFNTLLSKLGDRKIDEGSSLFHFWTRLLAYDPGVKINSKSEKKPFHRMTSHEALRHKFFSEEPKAIHPSLFPTWPSKHKNH